MLLISSMLQPFSIIVITVSMFELPMSFLFFLFTNLVVTIFMTGICFYIQFVHYPLFLFIAEGDMPIYLQKHQRFSSLLIFPVMTLETFTAFWLCFEPIFTNLRFYFNFAFLLVLIIWITTLFLQFPCYRKLLDRYNEKAILFLIRSNWIRTVVWSMRTLLMVFLAYHISHQCYR